MSTLQKCKYVMRQSEPAAAAYFLLHLFVSFPATRCTTVIYYSSARLFAEALTRSPDKTWICGNLHIIEGEEETNMVSDVNVTFVRSSFTFKTGAPTFYAGLLAAMQSYSNVSEKQEFALCKRPCMINHCVMNHFCGFTGFSLFSFCFLCFF